jgi:hypothetical protein
MKYDPGLSHWDAPLRRFSSDLCAKFFFFKTTGFSVSWVISQLFQQSSFIIQFTCVLMTKSGKWLKCRNPDITNMKMKHIGEVKRFLKAVLEAVLKAVIPSSDLDHFHFCIFKWTQKRDYRLLLTFPKHFVLWLQIMIFIFQREDSIDRSLKDLPSEKRVKKPTYSICCTLYVNRLSLQ